MTAIGGEAATNATVVTAIYVTVYTGEKPKGPIWPIRAKVAYCDAIHAPEKKHKSTHYLLFHVSMQMSGSCQTIERVHATDRIAQPSFAKDHCELSVLLGGIG